MTLVRKETKKGHSYTLDGKPVKGVTTLIGGGLPKPQLVYWSARTVAEYVADNAEAIDTLRATMGREAMVAALKQVPWDKRDEAAARGTDVHALAERIIHGEEVDVPEHLLGHVQGYVDWLDAWQAEPILTERPVASRTTWYAGTFDAILRMGAGELEGQVGLVDWKTSSGVYGETAMQLAAYANADFYIDADGNEQELPPVDFLGVVHITPTGSDLYLVADPKDAWQTFKHVAYVAKKVDAIKAQISQPTPTPKEMA